MNQLNIQIPEQLEEKLEDVVNETGLTKSELVRSGLINRLNEVENQ